MIHLVTFASDDMSISAQRCVESARSAGAGTVHLWNWQGFANDSRAAAEFSALASDGWFSERGCGYWIWKPWIIGDTLGQMHEGDVLIYSDAGVEFIEPVSIVIDRMDQDIWLFGNETLHAHWCKRDIIDEVYAGHDRPWKLLSPWETFDKQCQASVIFFRVNDYTRAFVKEWLDWCLFEDGRLIDDSPSRLPNHPEFKENRHDQAILTTLAYREGIKLHHWFVKYPQNTPGRGPFYPDDNYPPLFMHHRRRNHEWEQPA
jgi:hypothetical protein